MQQVVNIACRELRTFFDSLTAYVLIVVFLGFSGFFTWIHGADIFYVGQANLDTFFLVSYWSLFFFIPALTMHAIAEELKTGTLELLLTKPVSDWQLVLGKFLATLMLIGIALAPTLLYYFTLWGIGPVDHAAVFSGYLGLILMSSAYISLGLFTSSLTDSSIVAYLLFLSIGIFFHVFFEEIGDNFTGWVGGLLSYMSLSTHFESISRGVIDSKDLIYFFSLIFLGLYCSRQFISVRKING